MNKFVYIVLTVSTALCAESIRVLPKPSEFTTQQRKPMPALQITTAQVFNKIKPQLDAYLKDATPNEIDTLIKYLGYYRSWYQSTTPAPIDLQKSLTPKSNNIVNNIKDSARVFVKKTESFAPGSSTLNQNGHDYYAQVIDYLQPKNTAAATVLIPRVEPSIFLAQEFTAKPVNGDK
jgi:hypothetical protein